MQSIHYPPLLLSHIKHFRLFLGSAMHYVYVIQYNVITLGICSIYDVDEEIYTVRSWKNNIVIVRKKLSWFETCRPTYMQ